MPKIVNFKANSVIYFQRDVADKVFLLRSGKVNFRYIVAGGHVSDPPVVGEFFGVKSALGRYIREETAFAVDDVAVMVFTISEFENFVMTNTSTAIKMLKVFSKQLQQIQQQLTGLISGEDPRPDAGLFRAGEYYLGNKHYSQARYVFSRYLSCYPVGRQAGAAAENLRIAEESLSNSKNGAGAAGTVPAPEGEALKPGTAQAGGTESPVPREKSEQAYLTFQKGELIFAEFEPGDSFYLIRSGHVRLIKITRNGEEIIDVLQAPDIFGETAFLENIRRAVTAAALDTVTVLEFTSQTSEVLLQTKPRIILSLFRTFAARIYSAKRRFMILSLKDPQARAADVFLLLDETAAGIDKRTGRREFNITVDDVAGWAGMPRIQTREILNRFASQRRLEIFPDRVVVRNIDDFFRLVNSNRTPS
ncbi:MAG: Crp/Fnr family transcriptional regulator [Treponema sp.]|jgi:CRP-like cAMP-binding protein|nr:Crp/Fnr family transcriptional regulator [Treponema sp.]